jgi:hypothetical protein
MENKRAVIVSESPDLGEIISNKAFRLFPKSDIKFWQSGSLSIENSDKTIFQLDHPLHDESFFGFWDKRKIRKIKSEMFSYYFYLLEFNNADFAKIILNLIPQNIKYEIKYIEDKVTLIKIIKKLLKIKD